MENEEFLEIETVLEQLCVRLGVPELTEARFYVRRIGSEGIERPLPPRERVVEQIESLERFLSLLDRRTHDNAIEKIQHILLQSTGDRPTLEVPSGARIVMSERLGEGLRIVDLKELPDLGDIRHGLRELSRRLREA